MMAATMERSMSDRIIPFPAAGRPASERRNHPRGRCLLDGRALFRDHARTLDLTIRNLGPHGALIEGEGLLDLPEAFELAFVARNFTRPARVRWSAYGKAGVELGPASAM
jgi:hypothetical protein